MMMKLTPWFRDENREHRLGTLRPTSVQRSDCRSEGCGSCGSKGEAKVCRRVGCTQTFPSKCHQLAQDWPTSRDSFWSPRPCNLDLPWSLFHVGNLWGRQVLFLVRECPERPNRRLVRRIRVCTTFCDPGLLRTNPWPGIPWSNRLAFYIGHSSSCRIPQPDTRRSAWFPGSLLLFESGQGWSPFWWLNLGKGTFKNVFFTIKT